MPSFPTPGAYQQAVQFPETAFRDEDLRHSEPELTALGLPRLITGAFAAVVPLRARTRRWAVKCFLTDVPDQRTRYAAIADHLQAQELPYTVEFDYQPAGIFVDGRRYPILKMAWAEGVPLNRFVAEHLEEPAVLAALAEAWRTLLADLEAAEVAHGDLQHGNVLVQGTTEADGRPAVDLRLVDYDTMYVPALRGRKSPEVGHRNYQHPDRDEQDFGPYLDHFAGLVIYVALRASIAEPTWWPRYDTTENLLFQAADFYAPDRSPLVAALKAHDTLRPWGEALQRYCYLEPDALPPASETITQVAAGAIPLPAALARSERASSTARPARRPEVRSRLAQLFVPALGLLLVGAAVVGAAGLPWTALGFAAGGLAALGWAAAVRYQRQPRVRRRHRLQQELAYFDQMIEQLNQQVAALEAERQAHIGRADDMRAAWLRDLQDRALEDRLKYHFIGEAKQFEGITHKTVVRLKAAGIRTAYHLTRERLSDVRGLGDQSRGRVWLWRSGLVAQYQDEVPDALSPQDERRIERRIQQQTEALAAEVERIRAKVAVQKQERASIQARLDELPPLTPRRYVRYLLRLGDLPAARSPSAPAPMRKHPEVPAWGEDLASTAPAATEASEEQVSEEQVSEEQVSEEQPSEEQPWWETHGAMRS